MATPKNQSVLKAFTMLKSFRHPDEWVTSSELSRRAGLPEASGYRLIQTLEEIGAVVRGERGRYRPGLLLVSLSQNVAIAECLREAAREIMAGLVKKLNVTAHLGILEGVMVTYVAKFGTPSSIVAHTRPGAQLEPYSTGLGKILLSALPQAELDNFIHEGELVALTPYTITDRAQLLAELEAVRRKGFAMDERESRADMDCVAVPVRDNEGRIIAAMSASERHDDMTPARQNEMRLALFEAAASLSRKMYPESATLRRTAPARRPAA
ncbi:MAG: IclR family transcriptional regulator [Alphaproteobacteria bacterium]|nr:IclR family transcriptional regulator [Alphaproteobacteria bacterium]